MGWNLKLKSPLQRRMMQIYKRKAWQHEVTGVDGNAILFGVNIFDYEWKHVGERVEVKDPLYGQSYKFDVYTIDVNGKEYRFAAGEFSNCVYGFYVEKY